MQQYREIRAQSRAGAVWTGKSRRHHRNFLGAYHRGPSSPPLSHPQQPRCRRTVRAALARPRSISLQDPPEQGVGLGKHRLQRSLTLLRLTPVLNPRIHGEAFVPPSVPLPVGKGCWLKAVPKRRIEFGLQGRRMGLK